MTDDELLAAAEALGDEAAAVAADLGLFALCATVGRPVLVGSAALGLMVRRDLDVTVVCERLDVGAVFLLGHRLVGSPRVRQARFRNDTGDWNADPAYPDGLYWGVEYRSPAGHPWTLDVWFVDEPDRQPDLAHLRDLPPLLTAEARVAVLRLKHAWHTRPEYGRTVTSWDLYDAVLHHGVRTPDGLAAHLAGRPAG
jgi:hypothetical protein